MHNLPSELQMTHRRVVHHLHHHLRRLRLLKISTCFSSFVFSFFNELAISIKSKDALIPLVDIIDILLSRILGSDGILERLQLHDLGAVVVPFIKPRLKLPSLLCIRVKMPLKLAPWLIFFKET